MRVLLRSHKGECRRWNEVRRRIEMRQHAVGTLCAAIRIAARRPMKSSRPISIRLRGRQPLLSCAGIRNTKWLYTGRAPMAPPITCRPPSMRKQGSVRRHPEPSGAQVSSFEIESLDRREGLLFRCGRLYVRDRSRLLARNAIVTMRSHCTQKRTQVCEIALTTALDDRHKCDLHPTDSCS